MKIYETCIYVGDKKEWYQLEIINMWDWSTKKICFKNDGDGHIFSYCLNKYIRIDKKHSKFEKITELSDDIKKELISMGYTLASLVK